MNKTNEHNRNKAWKQGTDWAQSQNEGTNEGYPKWNKAKCTGNQQWREGNQDLNQWFGTKGRNKHPTGTEWRNNNSKKWREFHKPLR